MLTINVKMYAKLYGLIDRFNLIFFTFCLIVVVADLAWIFI